MDMDTVNAQSSWVEAEFDIDFHRLRDLYCPDGGTYIASVTTEIEEVFKKAVVITGYFCSAGNPTNENLYPCPDFHCFKI